LNTRAIDPNNAEYHSGYAYVLEHLAATSKRLRIEASIRPAPKSAQAHYSYGAFPGEHGRRDEAVAQYRRRCKSIPFGRCSYDLGSLLFEKGDLAEAKEHFRKLPTSTQNLLNHITIWVRFSCAKATSRRRSRNSRSVTLSIRTFRSRGELAHRQESGAELGARTTRTIYELRSIIRGNRGIRIKFKSYSSVFGDEACVAAGPITIWEADWFWGYFLSRLFLSRTSSVPCRICLDDESHLTQNPCVVARLG